MVRHAPVPVHEVLLVLRETFAFQDQGKHDVVAPPEQRAEGEFLLALEVLEIVQVLIGKVFEVLALHKLMGRRIEALWCQEVHAREFLLQVPVHTFQNRFHLRHDPGLRAEELRVAQENQLIRCEENRLGRRTLFAHGRTLAFLSGEDQLASGAPRS